MGKCTVIVTGASGSCYGLRLVEQLALAGHDVTVIFTEAGREVTAFELGFELPSGDGGVAAVALAAYLELPSAERLRVVYPDEMLDVLASGSYRSDAMIVAPCSMGFLATVAQGLADDLPARAADVMLKERRPLVLVPRESPLSVVHLRNLTAAAEAGAIIVPAMPGFYSRPESIDDLVNFVVGKVLDVLDVDHDLFQRWGERPGAE
jgi:4-hydroxy-3-polyprenylbenzoate decarboxylase